MIALLVGLVLGFAVQGQLDAALADTETGVWMIRLMLLTVVVPYLALTLARLRYTLRLPVRLFLHFTTGLEVGYMVIAWQVLMMWFRHPEDGQLKPMFVATTVALAVLEYCQVTLKNMET